MRPRDYERPGTNDGPTCRERWVAPGTILPVLVRMSRRVIPADRVRLTRGEKIRLGTEIVGTYLAVRWWLLRGDVSDALVAARRTKSPSQRHDDKALLVAFRLGSAVERTVGTLPFDSRCLIRSLVLTRILARRGLESSFVVGVSAHPTFAAHAWVEYAGIAVLPTDIRFSRLAEM
jgi:hypothetical protein